MDLPGVAEPDLDRGDVDGAAEDELALVGAHGHRTEALELVVGAFDGVANLVGLGVERERPPTAGALRGTGLELVALLRDRRLDPASAQVRADLAVRVRLVRQQPVRAGPGPTTPGPADPQLTHQRLERHRVMALSRRDPPGQRAGT